MKTVDLAPSAGGMSSGTLANGTSYTVVIPTLASRSMLYDVLYNDGVRVIGVSS